MNVIFYIHKARYILHMKPLDDYRNFYHKRLIGLFANFTLFPFRSISLIRMPRIIGVFPFQQPIGNHHGYDAIL